MFSRFFINRPIFASVLSIVIVLAGTIALFTLPVAQYPETAPPTVEVSAYYPGANAQVAADLRRRNRFFSSFGEFSRLTKLSATS